MGFQSTQTTKQLNIPPVDLITAGDDQTHVCSTYIYLEAIAEPVEDLVYHTITWEQTAGTIVDLQAADTLTPWFQTVDATDKQFVCYLDKGRSYEQSKSVWIRKTPINKYEETNASFTPETVADGSTLTFPQVQPLPVDYTLMTYSKIFYTIYPTTLQGEEPTDPPGYLDFRVFFPHATNMTISAGAPLGDLTKPNTSQQYIKQYELFENGVSVKKYPETPLAMPPNIAIGPPTDTLEFLEGDFSVYNVKTTYWFHPSIPELEVMSENYDLTGLLDPDKLVYQDYYGESTLFDTQGATFSDTRYGYIRVAESQANTETTVAWMDPTVTAEQSTYSETRYKYLIENSIIEAYSQPMMGMYDYNNVHETTSLSVTRYGQTAIGSDGEIITIFA